MPKNQIILATTDLENHGRDLEFNQNQQRLSEQVKAHFLKTAIQFDKSFVREAIEFLQSISINDAKQLLFILKDIEDEYSDFRYLSDDDIFIYLTNIIRSINESTAKLRDAFTEKELRFLPTKIHDWMLADLSIMLFFVDHLQIKSMIENTFTNAEEFKNALTNFLLFYTIEYEEREGRYKIEHILDTDRYNRSFFITEYEDYKKWYLKYIEPKKSLKWLNACNEEQIDNVIESLKEKGILILEHVFCPTLIADKVSLIIASVNAIPHYGGYGLTLPNDTQDIPIQLYLHDDEIQNVVKSYADYYIIENGLQLVFDNLIDKNERINQYDETKFVGIGISKQYCKRKRENTVFLRRGSVTVHIVAKREYFRVKLTRKDYIKLLKDSSRMKQYRASKSLSKDERKVTILKKNMALLEQLSKAKGMARDKFVNQLIEQASKQASSVENEVKTAIDSKVP